MKKRLAPQRIISLSTLSVVLLVALCSYLATNNPWLGLHLEADDNGEGLLVTAVSPHGVTAKDVAAGERLVALIGKERIALRPTDIMEEPDELTFYHDYNTFLDRQGHLHQVLQQPPISIEFADGRTLKLTPHIHRHISDLPWLFWYQLACGSIVFLAGMSVLAFRPREKVTLYYALTGFGLLLASGSAAIYSTRELALDGALFYTLSLLNQFGTYIFAGPFVAILWYYPQRIHPFPFGPVLIGTYLVCWLLNLLQLHDSLDATMRYPLFAGVLLNCILALVQWHRSRHQPVMRAILKWFLFAWFSGTSLFVGLIILPLVLNFPQLMSQSIGWGVLVTVYLGIALGITRYRLFNLDRWVVTGWFWFLGGIGVIALDALLVSLLDLSDHLALATALAISGWLYFPVRQFLWSHLSWGRKPNDYRELLPNLLNTLLNIRSSDLQAEWTRLLQHLFAPLNIAAIDHAPPAVVAHPEGIHLTIPGFNEIRGLRLSYADRGNRLFNEEDRRLADAIHQLFCHIQAYRQAFAQGVHEERMRVARDLHDDVGARLLSLVYAAENEQQADLARETLQELREVIRNLEQNDYTLHATLAELHMETARRCEPCHINLAWQQSDAQPDHTLEARQYSNLQRIVREAVSNALRHSRATILTIRIDENAGVLGIAISNDGVNFDANTPPKPGRGTRNIRARAEELGGSAEWSFQQDAPLGGYTVTVRIPLVGGNRE